MAVVPPQSPPGEATARRPGRKAGVVAVVAALALGLDITSKALVVANLTPGVPIHVIGNVLEWNLLRNSGAAFSLGTGYTVIFTLLAMIVVVAVIRMAGRLRSTGYAIAFGLLLAGAMGNLGDRIFRAPGAFRGDVVDWIEVTRYYPVFNLADSAICIAAVLFVLLSLFSIHMDGSRGERAASPPDPVAGDGAAADAPAEALPALGGTTPRQPPGETAGER